MALQIIEIGAPPSAGGVTPGARALGADTAAPTQADIDAAKALIQGTISKVKAIAQDQQAKIPAPKFWTAYIAASAAHGPCPADVTGPNGPYNFRAGTRYHLILLKDGTLFAWDYSNSIGGLRTWKDLAKWGDVDGATYKALSSVPFSVANLTAYTQSLIAKGSGTKKLIELATIYGFGEVHSQPSYLAAVAAHGAPPSVKDRSQVEQTFDAHTTIILGDGTHFFWNAAAMAGWPTVAHFKDLSQWSTADHGGWLLNRKLRDSCFGEPRMADGGVLLGYAHPEVDWWSDVPPGFPTPPPHCVWRSWGGKEKSAPLFGIHTWEGRNPPPIGNVFQDWFALYLPNIATRPSEAASGMPYGAAALSTVPIDALSTPSPETVGVYPPPAHYWSNRQSGAPDSSPTVGGFKTCWHSQEIPIGIRAKNHDGQPLSAPPNTYWYSDPDNLAAQLMWTGPLPVDGNGNPARTNYQTHQNPKEFGADFVPFLKKIIGPIGTVVGSLLTITGIGAPIGAAIGVGANIASKTIPAGGPLTPDLLNSLGYSPGHGAEVEWAALPTGKFLHDPVGPGGYKTGSKSFSLEDSGRYWVALGVPADSTQVPTPSPYRPRAVFSWASVAAGAGAGLLVLGPIGAIGGAVAGGVVGLKNK